MANSPAIPFDAHCPCYPMLSQGDDRETTCRREPMPRRLDRAACDEERANPGRMTQFLGTHQNRLDAKGRVRSRRRFAPCLRARAEAEPAVGTGAQLVLRPSHKHPCIEAWPAAVFQQLATPLDRLDLFSEEHDDLAAALYADAFPVESDKEGRIVLPEALAAHAGLDRRRRVHGPRPHLPDLGARSRRAPPGRGARARPQPRHDPARQPAGQRAERVVSAPERCPAMCR